MVVDSERQRELGGADVGRVGEDFRDRQHPVLRVVVVDGELAVAQRAARVEFGVEIHAPAIEPHRQGQRLEGRTHFIDAGGQPVDARRIVGFLRIVRIVIGFRRHGDDLAGVDVEDQAGRGLGAEFLARLGQFVAQRELHAQIERQIDRPLQAVGGKPRHVQRGEALPVQPFLDAGDALVVDIHMADLMRDRRPVRIDALVLGEEADAGETEAVNFLLLLGGDFALEPDEAALRRQPLAHFAGVEIGHHRGQQFDRLVDVDQLARLGEQRRCLDVGGDDGAIAVEDVGTRGGDGVLGDAAARAVTVAHRREHHQTQRDDAVDTGDGDDGEAEPGLRLHIAVDVVAIEQRTHRALPARFAGLAFDHAGHRAHRGLFTAGALPVVSGADGASMVAIGSVAGDGGSARSGKASKESNCVASMALSFK